MMQIIYWAHSYREEDAVLNRYFGTLIETAANMVINFDPPSKDVNNSKLSQNLRSCDGMVTVLTWRDKGPSQYILYEIALALRARKPLLVFMDDRLSHSVLPGWIFQRRFSHRTYFRQAREHSHALRELKSYMGDPPPARYEPSSGQRACGLIGLSSLNRPTESVVRQFLEARGYRAVDLEGIDISNPLEFENFDQLARLHVGLQFVDCRTEASLFWAGALRNSAIPLITITTAADYPFSDKFPIDFQPRMANTSSSRPLQNVLEDEFDLYEQDFLKAEDLATIERYTQQVLASSMAGRYDARGQHVEVIMGDKFNMKNTGAFINRSQTGDVTVKQIWNKIEKEIDFSKAADELRQLREHLERKAASAEEKFSVTALTVAEQSAREKNGPKMIEYLKSAGHWAYTFAEGLQLAHTVLLFKGLGFG